MEFLVNISLHVYLETRSTFGKGMVVLFFDSLGSSDCRKFCPSFEQYIHAYTLRHRNTKFESGDRLAPTPMGTGPERSPIFEIP